MQNFILGFVFCLALLGVLYLVYRVPALARKISNYFENKYWLRFSSHSPASYFSVSNSFTYRFLFDWFRR